MQRLGGTKISRERIRDNKNMLIALLVFAVLILAGVIAASVLSGLNNKDLNKIKHDIDDDDGSSSSSSSSGSSSGSWKRRGLCDVRTYQQLIFCDPYDGTQGIFDPADNCPYFYFSDPTIPYTGNDGIITRSNRKVTVTANPFTLTIPQGPAGTLDHVKNLALRTIASEIGEGQTLRVDYKASCQTFNVTNNPFPSGLIADANGDPRLAACALNQFSSNLFIVNDWIMDNENVWCLNERLFFGRTPSDNYRAYTTVKLGGKRKSPYDVEELSMEYDRPNNEVRWLRNGKVVCNVTGLGTPTPDFLLRLDHGGDNRIVDPDMFNHGWGLFTLLDMADFNNASSNEGLVRLVSGIPDFYVFPNQFYDDASEEQNRLFGQGAQISVYSMKITLEDSILTESSSSDSKSGHGSGKGHGSGSGSGSGKRHKREVVVLDEITDTPFFSRSDSPPPLKTRFNYLKPASTVPRDVEEQQPMTAAAA
jgi:hypothetical protein